MAAAMLTKNSMHPTISACMDPCGPLPASSHRVSSWAYRDQHIHSRGKSSRSSGLSFPQHHTSVYVHVCSGRGQLMPGPAWEKKSKEDKVHRLKEKRVKGREQSKDTRSLYVSCVHSCPQKSLHSALTLTLDLNCCPGTAIAPVCQSASGWECACTRQTKQELRSSRTPDRPCCELPLNS